MKKKIKNTIALFLACCMILSLAACGGGTGGPTVQEPGIGGDDEGTLREEGYVFLPEFIDIYVPGQWPHISGISGDMLIIMYSLEPEEEFGPMAQALGAIRTDGTGFVNLWTGRTEMSEDEDGLTTHASENLSAVTVRRDGGFLAIRNVSSSYFSADSWGFEEDVYLMAFTADGTVEREINLGEILDIDPSMGFWVNRLDTMSDGRVLIGTWDRLYVLTPDWGMDAEVSWDSVQNFLVTKDDQILVSTWGMEEGGANTWFFDLETSEVQNTGDPVFTADIQNAQIGVEYDLYVGTQAAVFGFDLAAGRSIRLFDWMDLDMLTSPSFVVSDEGAIYFFEEQWGMEGRAAGPTSLVRLTKRDASELPARTEIIYGGLFIDFDVRREIVEFNRRSTEYRIRVREYGDWLAMDQSDAIRRLNTDIITGNAPDILDLGRDLPFEHYARRGFLADMGALIDADPELNQADLVESVMRLIEIDGTLYTAMAQFNIQTLAGRRDLVGPDMGWTMNEFLAAVDAMPEGGSAFDQWVTRQSFLNSVLGANLGLFVDRETGTANFDSPLFMDYLTFAQTLQTEEELWGDDGWGSPGDWARPAPMPIAEVEESDEDDENGVDGEISGDAGVVASPPIEIEPPIGELPGGGWDNPFSTGRVLLQEQWLWSFNDIIWLEEQFGGPVTFKGYPSEQGTGSVLVPRTLVAISANSQHQDVAWSFVRTLLTERWQRDNVFGLATNRTILEEQMAQAMAGRPSEGEWDPGMEGATQAQIDQIMALINQVDLLAMRDVTVLSMIETELLPFFAGDRSIQETVRIIQSRVQTYLNERG